MCNDRGHDGRDPSDTDRSDALHPEIDLFREAVRDVRPLAPRLARPVHPKPPALARFTRADHADVLAESLQPVTDPALLETGDELAFRRHHVPESVVRRLRRGQFAVDAEIDLHGLTAVEARAALRDFIADSSARRFRCVRIVHGKGKRSGPRGPVLKNVVNLWLRKSDRVLAFGSARPVDGGSGAVYVLLGS
ncbi:MAG TPA: Smr/MutS family protein [Steroidobacteraceae bacterium]|nr:Smr/MutS family protein [Steroidobacteraceae bacterium]